MSFADKNRLNTLDAFRGLAALSVMLFHYTTMYRKMYNGHTYSSKYDFAHGDLGVPLFFMLSGFVIYMTVLKCKTGLEFLFKRFTRLYPVFWASIFLILFSHLAARLMHMPVNPLSLRRILFNFTMIPKILGEKSLDGAYWSLQVEFFFYISIFLLIITNQMKNVISWGLLFISFTWIDHYLYTFHRTFQRLLCTEFSNLFLAGIMFYKFRTNVLDRKKWWNHLFILLCFVTAASVYKEPTRIAIVGVFFLSFYAFAYGFLENISWKPLLFLGSISYPLYLVHQHIGYTSMQLVRPYLAQYPLLFLALPISLAIIVATLFHYFIELPCAKWFRKRFS